MIKSEREVETRNSRTRTPAAALTVQARSEDRRTARMAGFQAHLSQPVERGELLAVVANLAGRT